MNIHNDTHITPFMKTQNSRTYFSNFPLVFGNLSFPPYFTSLPIYGTNCFERERKSTFWNLRSDVRQSRFLKDLNSILPIKRWSPERSNWHTNIAFLTEAYSRNSKSRFSFPLKAVCANYGGFLKRPTHRTVCCPAEHNIMCPPGTSLQECFSSLVSWKISFRLRLPGGPLVCGRMTPRQQLTFTVGSVGRVGKTAMF